MLQHLIETLWLFGHPYLSRSHTHYTVSTLSLEHYHTHTHTLTHTLSLFHLKKTQWQDSPLGLQFVWNESYYLFFLISHSSSALGRGQGWRHPNEGTSKKRNFFGNFWSAWGWGGGSAGEGNAAAREKQREAIPQLQVRLNETKREFVWFIWSRDSTSSRVFQRSPLSQTVITVPGCLQKQFCRPRLEQQQQQQQQQLRLRQGPAMTFCRIDAFPKLRLLEEVYPRKPQQTFEPKILNCFFYPYNFFIHNCKFSYSIVFFC